MDWAYVNALLDVIEGTRQQPQLKELHDKAMGELQQIAVQGERFFAKEPDPANDLAMERRL